MNAQNIPAGNIRTGFYDSIDSGSYRIQRKPRSKGNKRAPRSYTRAVSECISIMPDGEVKVFESPEDVARRAQLDKAAKLRKAARDNERWLREYEAQARRLARRQVVGEHSANWATDKR